MDKYYLYTKNVASTRELIKSSLIKPVNREAYSSLFYYGAEMKEYLLKNGTVSGYSGDVFGTYFVLDIDSQDVPALVLKMEKLLDDLKDVNYRLCFSGAKGFHLYIPKEYVSYPDGYDNHWNVVNKVFANEVQRMYPELAEYIDLSVYDKVRIFRLPFSIHPKTGREKILLEYIGIDKKSPLKSFRSPIYVKQEIMTELLDGKPHPEAERYIVEIKDIDENAPAPEHVNKIGPSKAFHEYPYGEKLCIYKMLNTPDLQGMRHVVALRLQSYWKEKGYNERFTFNLLKTWNDGLTKPLTTQELKSISKSYKTGYIFTCNDAIKKNFCIASCHMYKSKDIDDDYIYQGDDYISRYKQDLASSKDNYIFMQDIYHDWVGPPIKPGYVITLAAGPGSGKTTMVLNMMYALKHINWLFLSLEMGGIDITEKFLKLTETDVSDRVRVAEFTENMGHIVTIDKPDISIDEIADYIKMIKGKTGTAPNAVVIDYLSLMGAKGRSQTEKVIEISKGLKKVAKDMRVAIFVLSQVPKDLAGDGNIPLGLDAPKDSGEVVNMSDALWTFWRPHRNRSGKVEDNVLRMGVPKDRHGPAGYSLDFEFVGAKYQVNSIEKGHIRTKEDG